MRTATSFVFALALAGTHAPARAEALICTPLSAPPKSVGDCTDVEWDQVLPQNERECRRICNRIMKDFLNGIGSATENIRGAAGRKTLDVDKFQDLEKNLSDDPSKD